LLTKRFASFSCAALLAGAVFGVTAAAASAAQLSGAGSTLVAPIEAEWATAWANSTGNPAPTYAPVGSGTGIKDVSSRLVDFGASDAPLTGAQASGCGGCVQIPWALSATGVGFHINGLRKLHLTGAVIASIYLGQITHWNDRRITSLNKGVRLPNLRITPFHRHDGSGDTYAFTDYEARVSGSFKHSVGTGTSVGWPTQAAAQGKSGMVTALEGTNGSIAYVAVSYLIAHQLPAVAIKNAAGNYEYPNLNNIENAARTVKHVPSSNELHIVNPPRSASIAYPISTFTYVIVPTSAPQASALKQWILYAMGPGQSFGPGLDFAPIPRVVLNAGKATLGNVH
jgi:phosphate transport system substrate-binding protein